MSDHILLAHGNGGRRMRELIENIFARHLGNPLLDTRVDAATLPPQSGPLCITTDGFIVHPLEFPGGNIGTLAVNGTLNDLAVAGALPRYLTLNAIMEEGLEISQLNRIIESLAHEAQRHNVVVVAGDTKVVRRGEGGGLYLATTGVGLQQRGDLGLASVRPDDILLISGSIGDHGAAVMLAREEFGLSGQLVSDCACVLPLTQALLPLSGLRFMRDPTRGGLNAVAHEIVQATGLQVRLRQTSIPIRPEVATFCEILGFDPLSLACEGRVLAIVSPEHVDNALKRWHSLPQGEEASIVGRIESSPAQVVLETALGGERLLQELEDDPLPRIC